MPPIYKLSGHSFLMRHLLVITLVLVICVIFIVRDDAPQREDFANIDSKATVLANWIAARGQSSRYVDFIRDNPDSNIVEYARLRGLMVDGTINNHARVVEALRV